MTMSGDQPDGMFKPFVGDTGTEIAAVQDLEEFDPFQVGDVSPTGKKNSPGKSRQRTIASSGGSVVSKGSTALPPRLDVMFKVHEEISSTPDASGAAEGSSSIFVEGIVMAQVTSSDAIKNAPFILVAKSTTGAQITFKPTEEYAMTYPGTGQTPQVNVIKIPKSVFEFVDVGSYQLTEKVAHLPLLLERKVTRANAKVQIAIQVRSKLANPDDMKQMSIVVSISDKIAGDSVEINVGKGEWDRASRTILWRLDQLPKGESFMVSARGKLTEGNESVDTSELSFPVMMRCESGDQISSATFEAVEASGYPATISTVTLQKSFRIVHRLT